MTEIFANNALYLIKYFIAFGILFIILPCFIFSNIKTDIIKSIVSNYIKITFWIIVFGYLLVVLRLFEFISILVILIIFIFYKYYKKNILLGNTRNDLGDNVQVAIIKHVDYTDRIENRFVRYIRKRSNQASLLISKYFSDTGNIFVIVVACILFGYLFYLGFYDSLVNSAPSGNEAYSALVSIKNIGNNLLFSDEIYPQGFYILLGSLQKILRIDYLYIYSFSGALNYLLISFGIYLFVSRLSKNKASGMIAVIMYSVTGLLYSRTNFLIIEASPHQYAVAFLFPVLYFFHEYLDKSKKEDFFPAFLGAALIGLIDPVIFGFLIIGILSLCLANIIRDAHNRLYEALEAIAMTLMAAIIAALPIIIGLIFGGKLNSDFTNLFTQNSMYVEIPELGIFDYFGLGALAVIILSSVFSVLNKNKFIYKLWIVIFGVIVFLAYMYLGIITNVPYLNEMTRVLWGMFIALSFGYAFSILFDIFRSHHRSKYIVHILCIAALIGIFYYLPTKPIITEKLEYNSAVMAYVNITKTYRPTEWMIVSWQEEYPIVLGNGFHMMIDKFIGTYNPSLDRLYDKYNPKAEPLNTMDIFIYYDKNIFNGALTDSKEYEIKNNTKPYIFEWITIYQEHHENMSLYYDDENITIWRIHQEPPKNDEIKRILMQ